MLFALLQTRACQPGVQDESDRRPARSRQNHRARTPRAQGAHLQERLQATRLLVT